jgi:hypothetical protein
LSTFREQAMPIPFAKRSEPRGTKKPRSLLRTLKNWIVSFAVAFAVLAPLRSAIADWNDVPTGSMEPTILPGGPHPCEQAGVRAARAVHAHVAGAMG